MRDEETPLGRLTEDVTIGRCTWRKGTEGFVTTAWGLNYLVVGFDTDSEDWVQVNQGQFELTGVGRPPKREG